MSNLLDAARQALGALEWCSNLTQTAIDHKSLHTAIATLRTAIAEAEAEADDVEILATYGRDDGWREWANVGTWLYPGDRIVVLRREEER